MSIIDSAAIITALLMVAARAIHLLMVSSIER